jgi:hypothetical protein
MLRARYLLNMVIFLCKSCKIRLQITNLRAGHDFAARSCCDLDLQGSDPNIARDTSSQYGDHLCEMVIQIRLKIMKIWAGQDFFAARSCSYLYLQASDPNVACDTLSQYGYHFVK